MDPIAHRPMTIPNLPMHMSSTPANFPLPISSEMQHNNGVPSKSHIVHGMDVSRLSQEDMSPGPSGVGVGEYGYHPSSIPPPYRSPHYPPYYPAPSLPQLFLPANLFDHRHPRGHRRPLNYPPTHSIPPYPDPQHYLQQYHHHHHQQQKVTRL